jgi:hypothetical protein
LDGCTLSSGFLLVETVPGREGHVLEALARVPGVTQRNLIFPAAIAVKLDIERERFDPTTALLGKLEGVVGMRLYRVRGN